MTEEHTLKGVKSSELRSGDLVHVHGMDVRLTGDPTVYTDRTPEPVYAFRGHVENMSELRKLDPWLYNFVRGGRLPRELDAAPWTIQGNDRATWTVTRGTTTEEQNMTETKLTGLTGSNVQALEDVFQSDRHGMAVPGFVTTTQTTATFHADAAIAARMVRDAIGKLTGRGHPKASLHAVLRKLNAQADQ